MSNYNEIDLDEIKILIKEAKDKRWDSLRFSFGSAFTEIPTEIFEIESLRELDLRYNRIKNISPEISKLTILECLLMDSNQIETLPGSFAQLINLNVYQTNYLLLIRYFLGFNKIV